MAIDVDGTLVDAGDHVSEPVEQAVRDARAAGVEVVLVSGRPEVAAMPIFTQLGLALPLISSGGAYVTDPGTGRVIDEIQPAATDVRAFVELARAARTTLIYQTPHEMFGEGSPEILDELRAANRTWIEPVDDGLAACPEPIKVTACGPRRTLDALAAAIGHRALALSVVFSGPEYLEITATGVSKGKALRRLVAELGVPLDRVLVIGDAPNDISMFAEAGLAVAMGNAPPDVQAAADVVAPTVEDDGVAWALRQFVIGKVSNVTTGATRE